MDQPLILSDAHSIPFLWHVMICDEATHEIHGCVGRDEDSNLCLSTLFRCRACNSITFLTIHLLQPSRFLVVADQFSSRLNLVLTADEFIELFGDPENLSTWDFVACCTSCHQYWHIQLQAMSSTTIIQSIRTTKWKWPICWKQTWVYPIEVQWVISQWKGEHLTFSMDEDDQIAPSGLTRGHLRPWKQEGFEWARTRSLPLVQTVRREAWERWLSTGLFPQVMRGVFIGDAADKDLLYGLGISVDENE